MIVVDYEDYLKYGCPNCGCDSTKIDKLGGFTLLGICNECQSEFLLLKGIGRSNIEFNINGHITYPTIQKHPREGIPWHPINVQ